MPSSFNFRPALRALTCQTCCTMEAPLVQMAPAGVGPLQVPPASRVHSHYHGTRKLKFLPLPFSVTIPTLQCAGSLQIWGSPIHQVGEIFMKLFQLNAWLISVSITGEKESNVLRKVAAMTYDMAVEQKQSRMRPPTTERQDFKFAETFEGYNKRERKSSSGTSIFFAFFLCSRTNVNFGLTFNDRRRSLHSPAAHEQRLEIPFRSFR